MMKQRIVKLTVFMALPVFLFFMTGMSTVFSETFSRTLSMTVTPGKEWKHTLMKIMKILPVRTTPQIAVWIEDESGALVETLYVTKKYATQSWRKTPGESVPEGGIKRKESLPYWSFKHGSSTGGGQTLPKKDEPLPDTVTGASPKGKFTVERHIGNLPERFYILAEVNNSADFNEFFPDDAQPGDTGYSGGKYGSGQPAIVYASEIESGKIRDDIELTPIGSSSPDGSEGNLNPDLGALTTAKEIVEHIRVTIR